MHYIYILGLEHSGTTLSEDLLSHNPKAIGTGEAANFFTEKHMNEYFRRWGSFEDARTCSCTKEWDKCEFWAPIVTTDGFMCQSFTEKYSALCAQALEAQGESVVLIDSSKSMEALERVMAAKDTLGLADAKLCILFNIKDVRSFAQSMVKKNGGTLGLMGILRAFNLWLGVNQGYLNKLNHIDGVYKLNRYEELCLSPYEHIAGIYRFFGIDISAEALEANKSNAHIAIGNKDYVMRNRSVIKVDDKWKNNWRVKLAYALHPRARMINKKLMKDGL